VSYSLNVCILPLSSHELHCCMQRSECATDISHLRMSNPLCSFRFALTRRKSPSQHETFNPIDKHTDFQSFQITSIFALLSPQSLRSPPHRPKPFQVRTTAQIFSASQAYCSDHCSVCYNFTTYDDFDWLFAGRGALKCKPIGIGCATPANRISNKGMEGIVDTTEVSLVLAVHRSIVLLHAFTYELLFYMSHVICEGRDLAVA
jgi:hypothetical protein